MFGIDIPLVEVILALAIIVIILLVESLVVMALLLRQIEKTKKVGEAVEKLSEAILLIKKAEIDELDKLIKK